MPKVYKRKCDLCNTEYKGYGERFCSRKCAEKYQSAERNNKEAPEATAPGEIDIQEVANEGEYSITVEAQWNDAPKTLDELIALTEPDLEVWRVKRWKVKPYNAFFKEEKTQRAVIVPMYSGRIDFVRREDAPITMAARKALDKMAEHAPVYSGLPELEPSGGNLLEMVLPDVHIGKLGWGREIGEDYDSHIAQDRQLESLRKLVAKAQGFGVSDAVLVVGNDLLHTDNWIGTTTAGTRQDIDSRHAKMVEIAEDMLVRSIDELLGFGWRVHVVGVPGNHDYEETIHIARYLDAWYRNVDRVQVDAGPSPRKYHRHGSVLLGYTHGKEEKPKDLPLIMATERAREWSECQHREWHLGHIHKKREYASLWVDEERGVRVRFLSSVTGLDAWHHRKGYAHHPASEAFLWHPERGLEAIFQHSHLSS